MKPHNANSMPERASTDPERTTVRQTTLCAALALVAVLAGCTVLERSRETANPKVPALAIAQQVCSNCHGLDGNSISPNFPNLSGQLEGYFVAQMEGFRGHSRSDPAGFEYMWGLSKNLTDEQIKGLAAYFAAQQPAQLPAADPALVTEGKVIYENGVPEKSIPGCSGCHGTAGQGIDKFPRLANQHADYSVKQLMVFQRTDERPEGSIMKTIAHDMTVHDMQAVSAYTQALPAK